MKNYFFQGAPSSAHLALANVQRTTPFIRESISQKLSSFDLLVGQGNRADRIHTHLVNAGILPKFDYYFAGSKIGEESIASKWYEREILDGNNNEQIPYIWNSKVMWNEFFDLLSKNRDKKIFITSSAPREQHKELVNYPNVLFASPTPDTAVYFGDDKRRMCEIYNLIGLSYDALNYSQSEEVENDYGVHSERLGSSSLVVQATRGSGGVTELDHQALYFVEEESEFKNALDKLRGEGPIRVMKKYNGVPSNTSALALEYGTFISAIPSTKPCGVSEFGTKPGTSGGNQWDLRFPEYAISSQFDQLQKVGAYMASKGYFGVFGLDPIMPLDDSGIVFNSEINARAQGPDSQRAAAAINAGIPCLEELQIAYYLGCPAELFPNVDDYNMVTRWLQIPPYIKLFAKEDSIVRTELNGYYKFIKGTLVRTSKEISDFKITGAPKVGQRIFVDSPDNFLYVKFANANTQIYTSSHKPELTQFAIDLVSSIYQVI